MFAVNICRLSDLDPDGNGISQYPLSMEAVFPIGLFGGADSTRRQDRWSRAEYASLCRPKGAREGDRNSEFFYPSFRRRERQIQAHQRHMHEENLILSTIHNPLAANKLPTGLFGAYKEFVAREHGDGYQIRDLRPERVCAS